MQDIFFRVKKAGPLMTSTLALVIFAVLAVVIFVIFWDLESGSISRGFSDFLAGENVEGLIDECNSFAETNAFYNYCCVKREVKHSEEGVKKVEEMTCEELFSANFIKSRIKKLNCGKFEC